MFAWSSDWLEQRTEVALDPALPIIDPHHHLWHGGGEREQYLAGDLQADTGAGHNVVGTVFIDCMWNYRTDGPEALRPVGETETAASAAVASAGTGSQIGGIVSFADMTLGDAVDEVLDAHVAAGNGLFRGIRHATALDADPAVRRSHTRPTPLLMAEPSFRQGVRQLAAKGLTFDAWLYHPQITELTALANAVPECTFVLDHLGGPLGIGGYAGRRNETMDRWRIDIAEVAACPNVVVKLGGIGMVIYGLAFEAQPDPPTSDDLVDAWGGPIQYAIEQFGVDRCMFESNFPVDKVSCSYVTLWNSFKKMAAGASDAEKAALFHDTAARVYDVRL
ncbi:MAG: amidohydrolase 2 [Ilumatobacteraceae bacterium]|nr:amidohydrolase 2 [Ilumatobacteraceae bacterium]